LLHMDWSEVHAIACRLEHAITKEVARSLERALNYPKTCPHGNPIPSEQGEIVEGNSEPLTNLGPHERGVVVKISEESCDMLRSLMRMGLVPGVVVEVEERISPTGLTLVKIMGSHHTLSRDIASIVWVKRVHIEEEFHAQG